MTVVWDVFPYHNESLVLEVRKRELRDERFDIRHVAIQAPTTLAGTPREIVDPLPVDVLVLSKLPGTTPVEREDYLRHATGRALDRTDVKPDDYVLFGDVDEIPHGGAIQDAMDLDWLTGPEIRCLRLPYHSLLATWRLPLKRDEWNFRWPLIGTRAAFHAEWERAGHGWASLRALSGSFDRIEDAGWHLSSMGGPDVVLPKVAAFAHAGEPWTEGLDADRLRDLATRGRDVADRFGMEPCPAWELPFALIDDPVGFAPLLSVDAWNREAPRL